MEKDLEYHFGLLLKHGLECVYVINAQGRIIEHASKNNPIAHEKLEMLCMSVRLQHSIQSDFDEDLGNVNYIMTERSNLKFVSVPISKSVLLAIGKKNLDHQSIIQKIYSKQFFDKVKNYLDKYNTVTVGIEN